MNGDTHYHNCGNTIIPQMFSKFNKTQVSVSQHEGGLLKMLDKQRCDAAEKNKEDMKRAVRYALSCCLGSILGNLIAVLIGL